MSYILDALRRSESERRQGQIPDLGQQVQLIHKARKKGLGAGFWICVALVLNAAVLLVLFAPQRLGFLAPEDIGQVEPPRLDATFTAPEPALQPLPQVTTDPATETESVPAPANTAPETTSPELVEQAAAEVAPDARELPTVIVPSRSGGSSPTPSSAQPSASPGGRIPHLVELPLSFQKTIPDLVFNSHIYASDPASRRVMINNNYLRPGDEFSGIRVERITEDGVELSKAGQRFRVGVVRDWVSPR